MGWARTSAHPQPGYHTSPPSDLPRSPHCTQLHIAASIHLDGSSPVPTTPDSAELAHSKLETPPPLCSLKSTGSVQAHSRPPQLETTAWTLGSCPSSVYMEMSSLAPPYFPSAVSSETTKLIFLRIGAHPSPTMSSTPLLRPFTALTPYQPFHPLFICLRPCSPQRQRVPNPGISTSRTRDAVAPPRQQPPTAIPFCFVWFS